MRHSIYLSLCLMLLLSCKSKKEVSEVNNNISFQKEEMFTDLLDQGLAEDKLIFVDFYADWCLPCKLMEQDVFSDATISKFFNDNFINIKIDAEKNEGPDLAVIYQVKEFPTLIFVNPKGQEVARRDGLIYHTDLMNLAKQALNEYENQ